MSNYDDADLYCGGVAGQCPECIGLYRAEVGPEVPFCVVCQHPHWAYEDHLSPRDQALALGLDAARLNPDLSVPDDD